MRVVGDGEETVETFHRGIIPALKLRLSVHLVESFKLFPYDTNHLGFGEIVLTR